MFIKGKKKAVALHEINMNQIRSFFAPLPGSWLDELHRFVFTILKKLDPPKHFAGLLGDLTKNAWLYGLRPALRLLYTYSYHITHQKNAHITRAGLRILRHRSIDTQPTALCAHLLFLHSRNETLYNSLSYIFIFLEFVFSLKQLFGGKHISGDISKLII